jgi:hypothetical protein
MAKVARAAPLLAEPRAETRKIQRLAVCCAPTSPSGRGEAELH